jgi:hypothetical protein
MEHLYRAGTNRILKFDKSYQRKESHRVTDIDQLSLLLNPVLTIPIEIPKNENRKISATSPIEIKTEANIQIPQAPPLPPSLDLAIKLQKQSVQTTILSPDQETLWRNVRFC